MSPFVRRSITFPLYGALAVLSVATLPVATLAAGVLDVLGRRRWATVRALWAFVVYFVFEVAGLVAAAFVGRSSEANYLLQRWWATSLFSALRRMYGMKLTLEGEASLSPGPFLLFVRHSSTLDTLLPVVLLGGADLFPRYVLKRELLWDPCLDLLGTRLPNAVVRRDAGDPDAKASVTKLAVGLTSRDAIVIYPEGTRWSERARQRASERLRGTARLARVEGLTHVLPPRLGGPLALLDASSVDVVFCAHVGLEGAATLGDLVRGGLIGQHVRVKLWRAPRADVPGQDRDAWLDHAWAEVDAWVRDAKG
jgi:1-acyl-sn-glycerol-3-phosphate acyltransferase